MSIRKFFHSEEGAVTVDWVVLTAAVVGLGIGAVAAVRTGTSSLSGDVNTSLTGATVAQLDFSGEPVVDNYGGDCGGTPEYPVMDCGVVWFQFAVENINGQDYNVDDRGVIIDENGDPMALLLSAYEDDDGNFVVSGPYDAAGRLVDNDGVPL